jgi:hypothetical protein
MRPREQRDAGEQDMFRSRLEQIVDTKHALVKLTRAIDWRFLEMKQLKSDATPVMALPSVPAARRQHRGWVPSDARLFGRPLERPEKTRGGGLAAKAPRYTPQKVTFNFKKVTLISMKFQSDFGTRKTADKRYFFVDKRYSGRSQSTPGRG